MSSLQFQRLEQLHRDWKTKHKFAGLRTTFPFAKNLIDLYHWFCSIVNGRGDNIENYDFVAFVDPLLTIEENKHLLEGLIVAPSTMEEEGIYEQWTEDANIQLETEAQQNGLFTKRDREIRKLVITNEKLRNQHLDIKFHQNTVKKPDQIIEIHDIDPISKFFDLELARKGNMLIAGTNQSGKTNLALIIIEYLIEHGFWIVVFDGVGVITTKSCIRNIQKIKHYNGVNLKNPVRNDRFDITWKPVIYNISSLKLDHQKLLINNWCESYWYLRDTGLQLGDPEYRNYITWSRKPAVIIFEEAQLYARYLSSSTGQQINRIVTAGANPPHHTRIMAITPRIARIDTDIADGCQQRWLGFTDGARDKTKIKDLFGKKYVKVAQDLEQGQFIWKHGKYRDVVQVPKYKRKYVF